MLKAGVLGAGHLGKIHLKLLNQSEKYELVGFYDPVKENAQKVEKEYDDRWQDYRFADVVKEDCVERRGCVGAGWPKLAAPSNGINK